MDNINSLWTRLLRFHKLIIDQAKIRYEQENGQISPQEYFKLLTNHEQFNWLKPINQILTQVDEGMEVAVHDQKKLREALNSLEDLISGKGNQEFFKKYQEYSKQDQVLVSLEKEILARLKELFTNFDDEEYSGYNKKKAK